MDHILENFYYSYDFKTKVVEFKFFDKEYQENEVEI